MKAIRRNGYGSPDVLHLTEVEKPVPGEGEVLVKIFAAGVNPVDYHTLKGGIARFIGWLLRIPENPRVGTDLAGRVEAVGHNVTQFKPGDEVFGACAGSFAEYALARENRLALKPATISFEAAAAVPVAALTALQGLRDKGHIQPGQRVLINGASGGVGTFAVQIAKAFGTEVTAVCSPRNLAMARSIGADQVIDYTQADFTQNGRPYDLILAVNGYHSLLAYRRALSPQGVYVAAGGTLAQFSQALLLGPWLSKIGSKQMGSMGITKINQPDLVFMSELLAAGKVKPVIERRYLLSEVADAMRYIGTGHAQGKVVITLVT